VEIRRGSIGRLLLVVFLALSAVLVSVGAQPVSAQAPGDITIYFGGITGPGDPFHGVIARGAEQAGKDLGVKVVYIFPDKVTVSDYNDKLEQAMAAKPQGLVILGLDPKSADDYAKRAKDAGIVVAYNPAPPMKTMPLHTPDDPYVSRVGSDEYSAGMKAAEYLINAGVKGKILCTIQIPGDLTLTDRCNGVKDFAATKNVKTDTIEIANEPGQSAEMLVSYLRANTDTGAVITLGGPPNAGSREARKTVGRNDLMLGAFDLDPATLQSIKDGDMMFTIDQQPFWRGYIPILEITHYIRYGLMQANYFLSGPSIVDKNNVDRVLALSKQGYR
jgi:simple sugar transport system substrate-binding protein